MKVIMMAVSIVIALLFSHLVWPGPEGSVVGKALVAGGGSGGLLILFGKLAGTKSS